MLGLCASFRRWPLSKLCINRSIKTALPKHQLTSTAIATTPDGFYPWNVIAIMGAHETLRREMLRGKNALSHFDLLRKPWQVYCFSEWFDTFLKSIIVEHETVEYRAWYPRYQHFGAKIPPEHLLEHHKLKSKLDEVSQVTSELSSLASSDSVIDIEEQYESKLDELKDVYGELIQLAFQHYENEELYWPIKYFEYGEDRFEMVQWKAANFTKDTFKETYMTLPCANLTAMGIAIEGSSFVIQPESDGGWAGEAIQERWLMTMTKDLHDNMLPAANKQYMTYRVLIESIATEMTMATVEQKISQILSGGLDVPVPKRRPESEFY